MTYPYEDEFSSVGVDGSHNAVRDADAALFPDGRNAIQVLMKARVEGGLKPEIDHILSMQLRRGVFDSVLGEGFGSRLDAGGALVFMDQVTSMGLGGLGREELIEAFGALPTMQRRDMGRRQSQGTGEF